MPTTSLAESETPHGAFADVAVGAGAATWWDPSVPHSLGAGIRVLYKRSVKSTGGVIDRIVVAPSGVWVIDELDDVGEVTTRRYRGMIRSARLIAGHHDRTVSLAALGWQAGAVMMAVDIPGINVTLHKALCFSNPGAHLAHAIHLHEVWVATPQQFPEMFAMAPADDEPGVHDVDVVADLIAAALPAR